MTCQAKLRTSKHTFIISFSHSHTHSTFLPVSHTRTVSCSHTDALSHEHSHAYSSRTYKCSLSLSPSISLSLTHTISLSSHTLTLSLYFSLPHTHYSDGESQHNAPTPFTVLSANSTAESVFGSICGQELISSHETLGDTLWSTAMDWMPQFEHLDALKNMFPDRYQTITHEIFSILRNYIKQIMLYSMCIFSTYRNQTNTAHPHPNAHAYRCFFSFFVLFLPLIFPLNLCAFYCCTLTTLLFLTL